MDSQSDPLIGQLVSGRYRVIKALGAGGMGQVYLAEHEAIEKKIALKVLHLEFSRKAEIVTRFRQEAVSASRIKHPNVLDVFDFGQLEDGSFFLAMEFLEGCDLADDLKRRQKLDPQRALVIASQICRALAAAHKRGVVHRDMKPENVFLQRTADGEEIVKIVDFGIAQLRSSDDAAPQAQPERRLTKTGMIFGTPEYMAPEQAAGKQIDLRVDVYAVGVILYELFTGAVPFSGDSFLEVLNKHLTMPPPPMTTYVPELGLSEAIQSTILRALAKNPDERYASMNEFAQALMATPEGMHFGQGALSSLPGAGGEFTSSPGALTAAQFGKQGSGAPETYASPNPTAADGTANTFVAPAASVAAPGTPQASLMSRPPGTAPPVTTTGHTTSNTQLEGSSTTPPQGRSKGGAVAFSLLAVAAIGALGFFGFTRLQGGTAEVAPEPSQKPTPVAPGPSVAEVAPPAPAPPSASVGPVTEVTLSVETTPPGAVLNKNGFQVCAETPCDVKASPNEDITLEAKLAGKIGSARVHAQGDQTVKIKLAAPPKGQPRKPAAKAEPAEAPAPKAAPAQKPVCEMMVDGIKILRDCE